MSVVDAALLKLLDKAPLDKFVATATRSESPSAPGTTLLHVRFKENLGNTLALADFLCKQALNYALSRKRREAIQAEIETAELGDISAVAPAFMAARDAFIEFNEKYPHRASEIGEVLAYCIAVSDLGAAQVAAKMSLKTSANMPVHGLDGIHAKVEGGALVVYFLESKLSKSAKAGVADYAESIAGFGNNTKQYLLEYSIVRELGNLDSLEGEERVSALKCFDILEEADAIERRERSVGVVLYSDKEFLNVPAAADHLPVGFHEKFFSDSYSKQLSDYQSAAHEQLKKFDVDSNKCRVYFVAVPDADELRSLFYKRFGYVPKGAST